MLTGCRVRETTNTEREVYVVQLGARTIIGQLVWNQPKRHSGPGRLTWIGFFSVILFESHFPIPVSQPNHSPRPPRAQGPGVEPAWWDGHSSLLVDWHYASHESKLDPTSRQDLFSDVLPTHHGIDRGRSMAWHWHGMGWADLGSRSRREGKKKRKSANWSTIT